MLDMGTIFNKYTKLLTFVECYYSAIVMLYCTFVIEILPFGQDDNANYKFNPCHAEPSEASLAWL